MRQKVGSIGIGVVRGKRLSSIERNEVVENLPDDVSADLVSLDVLEGTEHRAQSRRSVLRFQLLSDVEFEDGPVVNLQYILEIFRMEELRPYASNINLR